MLASGSQAAARLLSGAASTWRCDAAAYALRASFSSSSTSASSSAPSSPSASSSPSKSSGARAKSRAERFAPRPGADMVGPPNPLSNLRPVKYGSAFEEELDPSSSRPSASHGKATTAQTSHPYSLYEFSSLAGEGQRSAGSSAHSAGSARRSPKPHSAYFGRLLERLEAAELEHRLRRVRSDAFHERFWADNNVRFGADQEQFRQRTAARQAIAAPASDADADAAARTAPGETRPHSGEQRLADSDALAPFYTAWLTANSSRHKAYNRALVGGLFRDLGPAFRYESLRRWAGIVRRAERLMGRGA